MAFFSHFPTTSDIGPLFRLLDDSDLQPVFDTSSSALSRPINARNIKSVTRSFAPRFDARESKDAYHLEGELPGVKSKDLDIEFTDPHTLVICGTSSREWYGSNDNDNNNDNEGDRDEGSSSGGARQSHKASVEDDGADGTVATQNNNREVGKQAPEHRYWITERSVGSFHRTFNFPARVDQDGVRASLREGILSVTVPKVSAKGSKKIRVD